MTLLVPEGAEAPVESNKLIIDDIKKSEMVGKAKLLINGEAIESGKLINLLEQEYVKLNEHYTSEQLRAIVLQVEEDLKPIEELN